MSETTHPYPRVTLRVPTPAQSATDLVDRRTCRVNESRADGLPAWAPLTQRTMQPWTLRAHRPKVERLPNPAQLAPESLASERPHPFDVAAMDDAALLVAVVGCSRETALKWIGAAGSFTRLSRFGIDDLVELAGISQSEAARVLAACELGRRGLLRETRPTGALHGAAEIARWFKLRIGGQFIQDIWIVGIDEARGLHGVCRISHGDVHGNALDASAVITATSRMHVRTIAIVHNHPSGDVAVTPDDMRFVLRVHRAAISARMKLADFIILGPKSGYSSMAEQGTLPGML
jgi:DNA repair protein RadC